MAQQQGVSVSALSKWCKQYRQPEAATLLPIAIQPAENPSAATETTDDLLASQEDIKASGAIEITLQQVNIQSWSD